MYDFDVGRANAQWVGHFYKWDFVQALAQSKVKRPKSGTL